MDTSIADAVADPILTVIIVTYKSDDVIFTCIDSIHKYNDIGNRLEIIIVDNSPNDYPLADVLRHTYKDLIIIKNTTNGGYGQGNNIGTKAANGKYLLFLNPDTELVESIFDFAVEKFRKDKQLALFGIKMFSFSGKQQISFFFRRENIILSATFLIKFFNKFNVFMPEKMVPSGACMFMRKSTFVQAGMFDENLFLFSEEPYIARKIKLTDRRYKIGFFPQKKIVHHRNSFLPIPLKTALALKAQIYFLNLFGFSVKKHLLVTYGYNRLKLLYFKISKERERLNYTIKLLQQIKKEIQNGYPIVNTKENFNR